LEIYFTNDYTKKESEEKWKLRKLYTPN